MDFEVRQAGSEDALGIAEVQVRAWRAAYRGLLSDEELAALSVKDRSAIWTRLLVQTGPPSITLVAQVAEAVVGFCSILAPARDHDLGPRSCEIAALYVDPNRWRCGIGSALLEAGLSQLAGERWKEVSLWVLEGNARALAFYGRYGFARDGASRQEDRPGSRDLRLRLSLT